MNYKLQLRMQESNPNLVYNTIIFDTFKVNIVERYYGSVPKLCDVSFRVRTLDDVIIKKKDGNVRIRITGEDLDIYVRLLKVLGSYNYRNHLIKRDEADQDFVHFILRMVIMNYQFN
ncbi:prevent-host-death protein [Chryseobacterium sp. GMJ5]|uniref:Prevent-host-death protein n=1 Tax=Chryseobacterium gilvum TaxID=2976534 RepID=A0ABT2VTB0_9FLAO|nr:prevent-host-death protein [Chryseobacterium gilvum]MCU7613240.1 prevent-host-death protein [Chryseobacterium gilvum]